MGHELRPALWAVILVAMAIATAGTVAGLVMGDIGMVGRASAGAVGAAIAAPFVARLWLRRR